MKIPRRLCAATLAAIWLALGLPLVASGGRPAPSSSVIPVLVPSSRPADKPDELRIRLVHRILLDRNAKASPPDDHSIIAPAPPEMMAAGVIPPFAIDDHELIFLAPDGTVTRRVPLADDPNVEKSIVLSPGREVIAVSSTVSSRVTTDEKAEGGEWPETITVYDRSGEPMYVTTQGSDDILHLSDSGAAVVTNFHTGEIAFVDRKTGASSKRFRYLGPYASGRPRVAINRSGTRVLIAAPTISLDRDRRGQVIAANATELRRRGVQEVWASLYDDTGRELWRKQVPRLVDLHAGVALSDDATRAYIPGVNRPEEVEPGRVPGLCVMLDGEGSLVGASAEWGFGIYATRFRADFGAFVLGSHDSWYLVLLQPDGSLRTVFEDFNHPVLKDRYFFRDKAVSPRLIAALTLTVQGSRLVLLLMDLQGNVLLQRNVGGGPRDLPRDGHPGHGPDDGPVFDDESLKSAHGSLRRASVHLSPDARWVAVRLPREIRVFEILAHDARDREGQR